MKQLRIRQGTRQPMMAGLAQIKNYQNLTSDAWFYDKQQQLYETASLEGNETSRDPNADYPHQDAFRLTRVRPRESVACLHHCGCDS